MRLTSSSPGIVGIGRPVGFLRLGWLCLLQRAGTSMPIRLIALLASDQFGAKSQFLGIHAKSNTHQLGEEQDGHLVVGVEVVIGFTLVSIQVHLAHWADRDHHVGFVLVGR